MTTNNTLIYLSFHPESSPDNKALAIVSSSILFFYILFDLLLYHFRSARRTRETIQAFLTKSQKTVNMAYVIVLVAFEVSWVYGPMFRSREGASFIFTTTILLWVVSNALAFFCLFIAFVSIDNYRIYMYVAPILHFSFFFFVVLERLVQGLASVDILLPLLGHLLASVHVHRVPPLFSAKNVTEWASRLSSTTRYVDINREESVSLKNNVKDPNA
jgi:hypothetical protein